jgi:AcrR family transcriptional regulator
VRGRPSPTAERERLRTPEQVFDARAVRREGDRVVAAGPKARRTRASILAAAARVFEAKGYSRTAIADIAEAADVSLGTVYQYFHDRADLVAALVRHAVAEMQQRTDIEWRMAEGRAGIERVVLGFVSSYAGHAAMAKVWDEVTFVEEDLAELRRTLGRVFTGSVERELVRAQRTGGVRADLDPPLVARALTGMVDRYCFVTYVLDPPDDGPPAPETSAALLADLWLAAITNPTQ